MPQIKLGPNRAYPSLPEPDGTSENTAEVLGLVKESLEIAQRRSGALQDSFVRVSDLSDLGFITYDSVSGIVETADDDSAIVSELSDLSDVGVTTPTNRNVLAADGDSWESRALVEADISDLGTYLTSVTAADVDSGAATNGQVLEADGLGGASWQTQAAGVSELSDLSDVGITTPTNRNVLVADGVDWDSRALIIADISDFTDNSTNWNTAYGWGDHAAAGYPSLSADEVVTGTWALDGPVTTSDFGTGGRVKDGTDTARPIGFNTMPVYAPGVNDAFDLAHNGMVWHNGTVSTQLTFTCDNDSTIPVGATYVVTSTSSGGVIIAEGIGVTVKFMNAGAAPTEGNVTMEIGGILTVFKYSDTEFWVWGSKSAGSSGLTAVVDDATPQLGGTLDANGNIIDMGVNTITDTKVGQWDTAYGWGDHSAQNYALTTGDTFTGAVTVSGASGNLLTLSGASPQLYFNDTSASADDFWIHVNGNNFYILTDRGDDGSWDSPHPLQLEADTNTGYLFGAKMPVVNAAETISAAWTFSSGLNIGSTSTTLSQLAAGKLGVEGKAVLQHAGAFTSGQVSIQSGGSPSGGSNGDIVLIY